MSSSRNKRRCRKDQSGSVLIEFALVSLALYLIMAITVEFGRAFLMANIVQNAAKAAAVSLSITKAAKKATTFEDLVTSPEAVSNVYDPSLLVVEIPGGTDLETFIASLPPVNRFLFRTTMLQDPGTNVFRYPGAVPNPKSTNPADPYGIALVTHDADGAETVDCCIPVLEGEIRDRGGQRIVDVWFNYPYQAAMLSSFAPLKPGAVSNIAREDGGWGVYQVSDADADDSVSAGTYSGQYALGKQYAFAEKVRPYRKLLTGEAMEKIP